MAGKSTGKKSRLSGRKGPAVDDRNAKRHKAYSIKQFLQPAPGPPPARAADEGDSSEEPEDQLPSQTPAVGLLPAAVTATGPQFTAPTAAGAKLQTALLRSLEHRFAMQQALETPAGLAAAAVVGSGNHLQQAEPGGAMLEQQQQQIMALEEEELIEEVEEEDGFQIFSQLAYEPGFLSQRPPEIGGEPPSGLPVAATDTSQQATQTQQLPHCSHHDAQPPARGAGSMAAAAAEEDAEDGLDGPSSQVLSLLHQQQEALRRASSVSAASHKTTPTLHSTERVQCDGVEPSGQKMFPMFRRCDNLKKLYIVRHGESTYNAAMQARGSSWADPLIFDAQLTERGKQQARALRQQLAVLDLPPDTLWLTSPLQRAMQTLLLACPQAHLLGKDGSISGYSDNVAKILAVPNAGGSMEQQPPDVIVLQMITEKVVTCGDIGNPASELRKRYPQLDAQLAALPELWWHCPHNKPNCALQKCFGSHETKDQVMSRIGAFRRWLQNRPESVIVAVGHSSYWRSFEEVCRGTKPSHMRNCEFRLIHF